MACSREALLEALASAARYDVSCACGDTGRTRGDLGRWIYPAALPDGTTRPVMKVALTSACERDCAYCALRAGNDCGRHSFSPDELARTFDEMRSAGLVQGIFLTSAIARGPVHTMDRLLATAEVLRRKYRFRGYLHLKVIPGAERAQVEHAVRVATRVSVNIEAPAARHLEAICPRKGFEEQILGSMRWIADLVAARAGNARSQTTQFVVGASDETDSEIVTRAGSLYSDLKLARVYYSAFQPQPGTPLSNRAPAPFVREHRLYQADFMLRKYGFDAAEIPFDRSGALEADRDPKQAWADLHPERFPIEVNRAEREDLLRVPGIGPCSADAILARRRATSLRAPRDLGLKPHLEARSAPYLLFDGRQARDPQLGFAFPACDGQAPRVDKAASAER